MASSKVALTPIFQVVGVYVPSLEARQQVNSLYKIIFTMH